MSVITKLRQRLVDLQDEAREVAPQGPFANVIAPLFDVTPHRIAWLSAAAAATAQLIPDMFNPYRKKIDSLVTLSKSASAVQDVQTVAAILQHVVSDLDAGALLSIADRVSAETFDDLLDHAEAYLAKGRKESAGVLAGVAFEDSARRVFRAVTRLSDKGKDLEQIINKLQSTPAGSPTAAERRRKEGEGCRRS